MEQFYIPLTFSHTAHSPLQHFVKKKTKNKTKQNITKTNKKKLVYLFKEVVLVTPLRFVI